MEHKLSRIRILFRSFDLGLASRLTVGDKGIPGPSYRNVRDLVVRNRRSSAALEGFVLIFGTSRGEPLPRAVTEARTQYVGVMDLSDAR